MTNATIVLSNGTELRGKSFGAARAVSGEIVFNTAMVGYPESLTDPSYAGQILTFTYPLIGNYGVPSSEQGADGLGLFTESERIHPRAIIVSDYSEEFSHWNGERSLSQWLIEEDIPGISGIDTRALTKILRENGVMMGKIVFDGMDETCQTEDYQSINFVEQVSCKEIIRYNEGAGKRVVLVDCGVKHNIIRSLISRGVEVVRVPWDYDFNSLEFDGLFLANGPGNPDTCAVTVENIRRFFNNQTARPCMGICMGNQLLAKAAGASIIKLKYGHRGHNQPVRMVGTDRCFITSQNHGFAVDNDTIPSDWEPLFINLNDGTNEGIRHKSKPWMSAQFHPEACSGPVDTDFMFDDFTGMLSMFQK